MSSSPRAFNDATDDEGSRGSRRIDLDSEFRSSFCCTRKVTRKVTRDRNQSSGTASVKDESPVKDTPKSDRSVTFTSQGEGHRISFTSFTRPSFSLSRTSFGILGRTHTSSSVTLQGNTEEAINARRVVLAENDTSLTNGMLRYLLACHKFDAEKTKKAVRLYINFRRKHMQAMGLTGDTITKESIEKEDKTRKITITTCDAKGGGKVTVCMIMFRMHLKNSSVPLDVKIIHFLYYLEEIVDRMEAGGGELYVLFDLHNVGLKNADFKFIKELSLLQKVDRDLMKKVYFVNISTLFNGLWKVVKPWFSPRILNKIEIVKGAALPPLLPCEPSVLPDIMRSMWDKSIKP